LNYRQQVTGGYDRYAIEKRFVRKDGSVIWISVLSSSVRDRDGNFLYCLRVIQDITARRKADETSN
ncbi:MAG: domain S-box protein, partial [Rhodospirillales bacterium]|nr:domain S-box protein [Rhodospirillales bacterium]